MDHNSNRPIVSLASFLPKKMSGTDAVGPKPDAPARLAFENLSRRGVPLRQLSHPGQVVEALCGSLIELLSFPHIQIELDAEATWKIDSGQHAAIDQRLLDRRQPVWAILEVDRQAEQSGRKSLTHAPVAFELESGLCSALQRERSLNKLADLLDPPGYAELRSKVRWNLDLAHFAMGNLPEHTVRKRTTIRDRILHVHVSGFQSKSHFGDCVPTDENTDALGRWFDFLRELDGSDGRQLRCAELAPFSRSGSITLKATETSADVETFAIRLRVSAASISPGFEAHAERPLLSMTPSSAAFKSRADPERRCANHRATPLNSTLFHGIFKNQTTRGERTRQNLIQLLVDWLPEEEQGPCQHDVKVPLPILRIPPDFAADFQ